LVFAMVTASPAVSVFDSKKVIPSGISTSNKWSLWCVAMSVPSLSNTKHVLNSLPSFLVGIDPPNRTTFFSLAIFRIASNEGDADVESLPSSSAAWLPRRSITTSSANGAKNSFPYGQFHISGKTTISTTFGSPSPANGLSPVDEIASSTLASMFLMFSSLDDVDASCTSAILAFVFFMFIIATSEQEEDVKVVLADMLCRWWWLEKLVSFDDDETTKIPVALVRVLLRILRKEGRAMLLLLLLLLLLLVLEEEAVEEEEGSMNGVRLSWVTREVRQAVIYMWRGVKKKKILNVYYGKKRTFFSVRLKL